MPLSNPVPVVLAAGTYTPTLTNTANVTASSAYQCQYLRVGGTVTVSGFVDIDPTAAASTNTQLAMTLPIASAAPSPEDITGTAVCAEIASFCGAITADGSGKALLEFKAIDAVYRAWSFHYTYQIN